MGNGKQPGRNGTIGNKVWYFVIIATLVLLVYCAFPSIGRYRGNNVKKVTMVEFIKEMLGKQGMVMEKDKTYTYDFNKKILIVKQKQEVVND